VAAETTFLLAILSEYFFMIFKNREILRFAQNDNVDYFRNLFSRRGSDFLAVTHLREASVIP